MSDYLLLKWGTVKGWNLENSPEAFEALKEYSELGVSYSVMTQQDSPRQKELICKIINKVKGPITSDWDGKRLSKKNAKKYVMEYGRK